MFHFVTFLKYIIIDEINVHIKSSRKRFCSGYKEFQFELRPYIEAINTLSVATTADQFSFIGTFDGNVYIVFIGFNLN